MILMNIRVSDNTFRNIKIKAIHIAFWYFSLESYSACRNGQTSRDYGSGFWNRPCHCLSHL